jgi:phosphoserine aminotransferase
MMLKKGRVNVILNDIIASVDEWKVPSDAAYVHLCANETIHGLEFLSEPNYKGTPPLVIDMTSTLLSRPVDISKYGIVYASGGKNLGPAGVVVVIVRKSLVSPTLQHAMTPSVLSYSSMATSTPIPNIYNTPPTFLLYMMSMSLS